MGVYGALSYKQDMCITPSTPGSWNSLCKCWGQSLAGSCLLNASEQRLLGSWTQQLWLPTQDLERTEPIRIPVWMWKVLTRLLTADRCWECESPLSPGVTMLQWMNVISRTYREHWSLVNEAGRGLWGEFWDKLELVSETWIWSK